MRTKSVFKPLRKLNEDIFTFYPGQKYVKVEVKPDGEVEVFKKFSGIENVIIKDCFYGKESKD